MFKPKIIVPHSLMEKLKLAAEASGSSSVDEFACRILEEGTEKILAQATDRKLNQSEVESITRKLKGLGYLE